MKVKSISTIPIRLPLKDPFHMSNFSVYDMHYVLIKVVTDTGLVGYGEATPSWDVNGETPESIQGFINLFTSEKMLGYTLLGKEVGSLEQVNTLIDTIINPVKTFGYIAENSSAKAGLEQALYSLLSQHLNTPLPQLLAIQKKSVPFAFTISILPVEDTVTHAVHAIKSGASIIRLKIGRRQAFGHAHFDRDVFAIKEISKLIRGKKIKLIADANQGFQTISESVAFCKQVEGELVWLEQPMLAHDLAGFKEIKKKTSMPLMADESITSYKDLQILLEMKAVDYVNIKLMKTGGYRGALEMIDLATRYGVRAHIGSMIESAYGIYMGLILACTRPEVMSTDLNVYDLLEKQYCSFSYKQSDNKIIDINEMPAINQKTLALIIKKYGYKANS